jgi:hypothetical protein
MSVNGHQTNRAFPAERDAVVPFSRAIFAPGRISPYIGPPVVSVHFSMPRGNGLERDVTRAPRIEREVLFATLGRSDSSRFRPHGRRQKDLGSRSGSSQTPPGITFQPFILCDQNRLLSRLI